MTKQEIYVKLGYTGEYTKEVKRKLRELIKKYHPDLNHGDDTTMKILNEVKNEIENNRVDDIFYNNFSNIEEEDVNDNKELDTEDYFKDVSIEMLYQRIEKLKVRKEEEYNKLLDFDKKLNDLNVLFNKKLYKYEEEKNKIEELKQRKYIVDKQLFHFIICTLLIFILMVVILLYFFKFYVVGLFFFLIVVISVSFYYKYMNILDINKDISISYANKNTYFNDAMDRKLKIYELEKLRFKQYINYRNKADDIQLYYYELTKKNNKTVTYQKKATMKK